MNSLLAKSISPNRAPKTLGEHTKDVLSAAENLYGTIDRPTRLGNRWLRFFRMDNRFWKTFAVTLHAASLLHDWGKANDRMQAILHGKKAEQLFCHEHLSVLLIGYPGVAAWLEQRSDIDWNVVLAAVGSHHLRFTDGNFAAGRLGDAVRVMHDCDDFHYELIAETSKHLDLAGCPEFPSQPFWGFTADPATYDPTDLRESLKERLLRIQPSPMLHAVRTALIVADAAGSGLTRANYTIAKWIAEQFSETSLCHTATVENVIRARINAIKTSAATFRWNTFQNKCEALPDRSLLLAPCGAGKTLAAWRWILGRIRSRGSVGRIIFLYPTRATATEGFKDYVSWAPESFAALLHGTSSYDLDGMFPPTDIRRQASYGETDPRLFALQHWSKRIFTATVDQFFAFLSYSYGALCLLPLLADSVVVIDEVHSFDKKMFSGLLGFLRSFDVPVLCMTATLQDGRKTQLQTLMESVYTDRSEDLKAISDAKRYQVTEIPEKQAVHEVRMAINSGKRVLWVVNQVSKAQDHFRMLKDLTLPVTCYHSRFKLDDRVDRHRETVNSLRAGQPPGVAITTQVCEMSLDIDADVLITEACPITSLIQRMGRCRRGRRELAIKGPGDVFVYKPETELVYMPDDLVGIDAFIAFLISHSPASQTNLETGLQRFGPKGADAPNLNSFIASGAYADGREDTFRDIEQFHLLAVLEPQVDDFLNAPKNKQPGFIVPVPRNANPGVDIRLPSYLRVADERHYDSRSGYHNTPIR